MSEVEVRRGQRVPSEVESLLRSLPDRIGIEEALMDYVADARTNDTYTAVLDGTSRWDFVPRGDRGAVAWKSLSHHGQVPRLAG